MFVKDFMSADPVCVEPRASALSALDLIVDEGVRHLPVVDAGLHVVGVISIDDLAAALPVSVSFHHHLEGRDRREAHAFRVGELMTYLPDTVLPSTPAEEAAHHMALKGIGCLPVVDEQGRLEGILSEADVLRAFAATSGPRDTRETRPTGSQNERFVEALRGERDGLAKTLALHDQVGPSLAAMRLKSLEEAIARAEQGELHACVRCKGTISVNRLRALPGTTICARCAREVDW